MRKTTTATYSSQKKGKTASTAKAKNQKEDPSFLNEMNTYIGQKGYTILKSELTKPQLDFLMEKLTIQPQLMGGGSI
jgi:hypothetical protein